jgi:excisionase family DNA binding protein
MSINLSSAGRPAFYTVREAAWILGVPTTKVSRAIRIGTLRAVLRRSRLVIPASEITRLIGRPAGTEHTTVMVSRPGGAP